MEIGLGTSLDKASLIRKNLKHKTPKPVELMDRIILAHTNPGDLVIEPFAGTAPVLMSCNRLNRKCISIDISEEYCQFIVDRLKDQSSFSILKREETPKLEQKSLI